jgi:hypothetical protein
MILRSRFFCKMNEYAWHAVDWRRGGSKNAYRAYTHTLSFRRKSPCGCHLRRKRSAEDYQASRMHRLAVLSGRGQEPDRMTGEQEGPRCYLRGFP